MSYTGSTRRNTVFIFVWLRHRNTPISIQHVGRGRGVLCAVVVQYHRNHVSIAGGGGGQFIDDWLVHKVFGAATHPGVGGGTYRRRATFERC